MKATITRAGMPVEPRAVSSYVRGVLALAVLASLLVILPAPNADAAVETRWSHCRGTKVRRCLELRYDTSNRRFQAWASIIDNQEDNVNYDVAVNNIRFADVRQADTDGWHTVVDVGHSGTKSCMALGRPSADFHWRNANGQVTNETINGEYDGCE